MPGSPLQVTNANASATRFCYACTSIGFSHDDDYTLYSKSGAVVGSWAAASDGCTDKEGYSNYVSHTVLSFFSVYHPARTRAV